MSGGGVIVSRGSLRRLALVFIVAFAVVEAVYHLSFLLPFRRDEALAKQNMARLQQMVDQALAERPELGRVHPDDLFLVDLLGDFDELPADLAPYMRPHRYMLEDGVRVNSERYYQNPRVLHYMGVAILAAIAALLLGRAAPTGEGETADAEDTGG